MHVLCAVDVNELALYVAHRYPDLRIEMLVCADRKSTGAYNEGVGQEN